MLAVCLLGAAPAPWLALSDIHLNPYDASTIPSPPGVDSNWTLFAQAVAQMRRTDPAPPVIVITGDFLAHQWDSKVQQAGAGSPQTQALRTMARIAALLSRSFPRAQFLVALGNNDDPCGDYRTSLRSPYLSRLARIWAPLVNRHNAAPNFIREFSALGAYTAQLPGGTRAVVLDDIFWSILFRRCGSSGGNGPGAQQAFLERSLRGRTGARRILIAHIPPGVDANSTLIAHRFLIVPFLRSGWQQAMLRAMSDPSARVSLMLAGHVHFSSFRTVSGIPTFVIPAISPIYRNNPGYVELQMRDGEMLDYRQYAYDEYTGRWSRIFDFDDAYDVKAFTAASLRRAQREIAANQKIRAAWAAAQGGDSPSREVTTGNWRVFWCAQDRVGRAFASCAGASGRSALLPVLAVLLAVAVAAGIIALILRLTRRRR